MFKRIAFPIFYCMIVLFAVQAMQRSEEIVAPLRVANGVGDALFYFLPQRIELRSTPLEAHLRLPDFIGAPRFGAIIVRADHDSIVSIVVDETTEGVRRIFIDRNNDENLANDGLGEWSERRDGCLALSAPLGVNFSSETRGQLGFRFYRFDKSMPNVVFYYRDYYAEGRLHAGERSSKVMLIDDNSDGRLNDLHNTTLIVDVNQDDKVEAIPGSAEMFAGDEPFHLNGESYLLREVSEDGRVAKFAVSPAKVNTRERIDISALAPEFSMQDFSGAPLNLSDYRGRVVLLHFWATWCKPCLADFPNLSTLYRQFGPSPDSLRARSDFEIIGISLDKDRDALARFVENNRLPWRQLFDGGGWHMQIAQQYRVSSLPRTFLLDAAGVIRQVDVHGAVLSEAIARLMEQRIASSTETP